MWFPCGGEPVGTCPIEVVAGDLVCDAADDHHVLFVIPLDPVGGEGDGSALSFVAGSVSGASVVG